MELSIKQKRDELWLIPFSLVAVVNYAGAGFPPVIGGRIGFSGFEEGSFN